MVGVEVTHNNDIRRATVEEKVQVGRVLRGAGVDGGDVEVDEVKMEVFYVGHNAQVLHDVVRGEKVVGLEGAERDAMVYKKRQAPTSTPARPVTSDHGVARDGDGARARSQLGLLYCSDPDPVLVEES